MDERRNGLLVRNLAVAQLPAEVSARSVKPSLSERVRRGVEVGFPQFPGRFA
jgi:hypothetical protein